MQTEKKEISECTFHPDINPRSQRIANDRLSIAREHEVSHFDQLYLDAERRRERLEEMSSWIPEECVGFSGIAFVTCPFPAPYPFFFC